MSQLQRCGVAVGFLLLAAYGLPLFFPPAAAWPAPPAVDAGLWQRVFPGVPACWVLGRLACLFVGAVLIALILRARLPLTLGAVLTTLPEVGTAHTVAIRSGQWIALSLALVHAAAGLFASHFNRLAETAYFVFLAVPAGVLALTEVPSPWRTVRSMAPRFALLLIVPLLWLAVSIPTAWRSPRAANVVDMWIMVERIEDVVFRGHKVLADSASPGHTNAYMMLEGIPLIGPGRLPVSFVGLQISHFFWAVVCGVGIGMVVWKMVGQAAAIVAEAAFLFSQYVLSSPYSPGPTLIAPLCAVFLLLLVLAVRAFGSTAALAAFGAVAGFSTTEPTVVVIALLLCAVLARSVSRLPHIPWLVIGVAVVSAAAAVLPGLPNPETLVAMTRQYTFGRRQLVGMVMILFGQQTPYAVMESMNAGRPGLLDLAAGALLAPFAIARTPLRLWGDALSDPIGTALMAVGLALCAMHVTRNRAALLVLGLLVIGLSQASTSSGDAVSHNRLAAALLPLAVCAGVGFETLRTALAPRWRPPLVAAFAAASIGIAGSALFAKVNPEILPASWVATSLEALGAPSGRPPALLLEHGGKWNMSWLYVAHIASLLPSRPLPTQPFSEFEHQLASADPDRIYFWSPALEDEAAVSRAVCDRWPEAALYTLTDEPGLFRALAAAPHGAGWHPALPKERWTVSFCEAPMCRQSPEEPDAARQALQDGP